MLISIILVSLLAVFTCNVKAQDETSAWSLSSCEILSSVLKPVTTLDIKKLQGHWVNLNKVSFGTKDVVSFSVDQDQSMLDEFTVKIGEKKKLQKVNDCVRQEIILQNKSHVLVKTALFYDDSRLNTQFDSNFIFDSIHSGYWSEIEHEDVLILQADPEKYVVFALCAKYQPRFSDEKYRTTIVTLGRYNQRRSHLSNDEQIKIMTDIATKLGDNEFLASQLATDCNSGIKFNFNILWMTLLFIISKYVF